MAEGLVYGGVEVLQRCDLVRHEGKLACGGQLSGLRFDELGVA